MSPVMDGEMMVRALNFVYLSGYLSGSATVILVYDYFITLRLEIELIWHSKWSYTKVLFLLIRYLPFFHTIFAMLDRFYYMPIHVKNRTMLISGPWILVIHIMVAETILALRTWAIWRRNWKVGAILLFAMLANFIALVGTTIRGSLYFLGIDHVPVPYTPTASSQPIVVSPTSPVMLTGAHIWMQLFSLVVVQFAVLAPLAISAFNAYRVGNTCELSNVIHRDGILCYALIFSVTLVFSLVQFYGLLIITITTSQHLEVVLYSVLTGRVVLNTHQWARKREIMGTELHTMHCEMDMGQKETMTLRFAPGGQRSEGLDEDESRGTDKDGAKDNWHINRRFFPLLALSYFSTRLERSAYS